MIKLMRVAIIFLVFIMSTALPFQEASAKPVPGKNRFYYEKRGDIVWEIKTEKRVIALTFDDGPDPVQTTKILDLLEQYHAKATFFVIGKRVQQFPDIVRRTAAEGHEIANHTFNHPMLSKRTSVTQLQAEIDLAEDLIFSIIGHKTELFRPPFGFYNETVVAASKLTGHQTIMWSWNLDTRDWKHPEVSRIVKTVTTNARNGNIVIFHDHVRGASNTIGALKIILPDLIKKGYKFVSVSELLQIQREQTIIKP